MVSVVRGLALTTPITALICLSGCVSAGPAVFVATDLTTDTTIACEVLSSGERVALVYTHSMYGGDVVEEFMTGPDDQLRRVAMTTANEAAAEYYADTVRVTRVGDRFRVEAPAASFAEIVVRVDRVGGHRLRLGGETVDVLAATGDGHRVRLSLRSPGLQQGILGTAC